MQWQPHSRRWKTQMRTNDLKDLMHTTAPLARTQEIVFDRKMMENLWRHMLGSRCWNNHLLNLSKFKSDFSKLTFFTLCCFRLVFASSSARSQRTFSDVSFDRSCGEKGRQICQLTSFSVRHGFSADGRRCEKWIQGEMDTLKTVFFAHHPSCVDLEPFALFKVVIHHFKVLIVSLAHESYVSALFINNRSAIFSLHLAREASIDEN